MNNNKIKQLLLLLITIPLLTSCIGHDTKPVEFEAYSYHVTMDKDGTITYRKVTPEPKEEEITNNAN